ncbi:MAG: nitroreductase family protein [Candidatus Omnitrophota bacterium]
MDEILKRRSIRRFSDRSVGQDLIKKILAAGMAAPSAGNEQPWQFIVVSDAQARKKLSECSPYARAAADAPTVIVVCGDLSLERHPGFWVQDCSAAVENMLLEIASLGLGSVWLGVYPEQDRVAHVRNYFSLPANIVPLAILPVGFPAQELAPANRYNEARVHFEIW